MKVQFQDSFIKDLKKILKPNIFDKLREKRFERRMKRQRYKQGYSDQDCWGMHYWFTETFPRMIYNLRDMKHGAPEYEFEEFEKFPLLWIAEQSTILMQQKRDRGVFKEDYSDKTWDENEEQLDFWGKEKYFDRWWMILSRIGWCLEQVSEDTEIFNEYEEEFNKQMWGESESLSDLVEIVQPDDSNSNKHILYTFKEKEIDPELKENYYKKEKEIAEYREECKDEAFDLLKKYFYNLWD